MNPFPFRLVCPICRGGLVNAGNSLECSGCGAGYGYAGGWPNLIAGGRFEDAPNAERSAYEERSNGYTARHYLLPTFRGLDPSPRRLLSLGCGTGVDVDVLAEEGFDIAGVDCGSRCDVWTGRRFPERLCLANGKNLPFEDATFDLVYCGCVFPHVGTDGDTDRAAPDYRAQRLTLAREMARVLRPGGYVLVSSPNRLCPVDLFHGRTADHPLPRWNSPGSSFLLSPADYRELFRKAGCEAFSLLPVTGYWGFVNRKNSFGGRLLALPVECVFRLVSAEPFAFLRSWPISPWLAMLMRKAAALRGDGGKLPGFAGRSSPR